MREKLIEMLSQVQYLGGLEEKIADHLIANGVTVQKWIPVTERLPKEWDRVLVCTSANTKNVARLVGEEWRGTWNLERIESVTHWMPLPEPPEKVE